MLHRDLPREGPGDRESLDWALGLAGVARNARILDAACGPGADIAGLLAHAPEGHVTAMDAHAAFVEQAKVLHGNDPRVSLRVGDMADPDGPYDLIWCAGALYFLGVTEGLKGWARALTPGGHVAFSEAVWLTETPTAELRTFWEQYPALTDVEGVETRIAAAGYRVLSHRILSDAAWEAYYGPLEARIAALRPEAGADLAAVLDEGAEEIRMWRTHRREFGYALFVVAPG